MSIHWVHFIILSLAAFRLTRLIVDDLIMEWLRKPFTTIKVEHTEDGGTEEWIEPKGFIGEGITCQWCVGIWSSMVVLVLYLLVPFGQYIIFVLSIAGLQSILYNWSVKE